MASKGKPLTPATGELREKALAWWQANMPESRATEVHVKGDGHLRFWWEDGDEFGSYHLPISRLDA